MKQSPNPSGIELEAAARMARLPVRRVRQYVRVGLVTPARMDGRRVLFDEIEIARLRRIRRLSNDLGLGGTAIEVVIRLIDQVEALQRELDTRRSQEAPRWRRTI
jgi:MerR family transcriptional regulator/heat shock protein HspR